MPTRTGNLNVRLNARDDISRTLAGVQSSVIRFVGFITSALATVKFVAFPVEQATEFDRALRDVQKTTQFSEEQLGGLTDGLLDLSTELDKSVTDLARIAATAGQLGIGAQGIESVEKFTASIALASTTLDLLPEEAARSTAKVLNVFDIAASETERVLSTVNELSNTTTANAKELLDVVRRVGSIAGLNFQEVSALAAQALELGISPESAGTSLVRVFSRMEADANLFAQEFGITVGEWLGRGALDRWQFYLQRLSQLTDAQAADTINRLSGSGRIFALVNKQLEDFRNGQEIFGKALDNSNTAFQEGTSLQKEYGTVSQSLEVQLGKLRNVFLALVQDEGLKIIENTLLPLVQELIEYLQLPQVEAAIRNVVQSIGDIINAIAQFTRALIENRENWTKLLDIAKVLVTLLIARTIGGWVTSMIASAGAAVALTTAMKFLVGSRGAAGIPTVMTRSAAATLRLRVAFALLSRAALGLLGGPLCLILTGGTLVYQFWDEIADFLGIAKSEADVQFDNAKGRALELTEEYVAELNRINEVAKRASEGAFGGIDVEGPSAGATRDIAAQNEATKELARSLGTVAEANASAADKVRELRAEEERLVDVAQRSRAAAIEAARQAAASPGGDTGAAQANFAENQRRTFDGALASLARVRQELEVLEESQAKLSETTAKLANEATDAFSKEHVELLDIRVELERQRSLVEELAEEEKKLVNVRKLDERRLSETSATAVLVENTKALDSNRQKAEEASARLQELQADYESFAQTLGTNVAQQLEGFVQGVGVNELEAFADAINRDVLPSIDDYLEARRAEKRLLEQNVEELSKLKEETADAAKVAELEINRAKGVFTNTNREVQSLRREIIEFGRTMRTQLQDRKIRIEVERDIARLDDLGDTSDVDARLAALDAEIERVKSDESLFEISREQKLNSLAVSRRRIEASRQELSIDKERLAVEIQERGIRKQAERDLGRVNTLLFQAQEAAQRGDINEALVLKDEAKRSLESYRNGIDELQNLTVGEGANIEFAVSDTEIERLVSAATAAGTQLAESVPSVNETLQDQVKSTMQVIVDKAAEVAKEFENVRKNLQAATQGLDAVDTSGEGAKAAIVDGFNAGVQPLGRIVREIGENGEALFRNASAAGAALNGNAPALQPGFPGRGVPTAVPGQLLDATAIEAATTGRGAINVTVPGVGTIQTIARDQASEEIARNWAALGDLA